MRTFIGLVHLLKSYSFLPHAVHETQKFVDLEHWHATHALNVSEEFGAIVEHKQGIGILQVDVKNQNARLHDGKLRLEIAIKRGVPFFPVLIEFTNLRSTSTRRKLDLNFWKATSLNGRH